MEVFYWVCDKNSAKYVFNISILQLKSPEKSFDTWFISINIWGIGHHYGDLNIGPRGEKKQYVFFPIFIPNLAPS